ncbi:MAG: efflux transporter periplasmic adaptor subunit [Desulfuromonas sp.]|nr:MAG: efflux transporter periplasmic adaptor subunit [Desulfuromonas sp.]
MSNNHYERNDDLTPHASRKWRILLPMGVLVLCALIAAALFISRPRAKSKTPQRIATLVEVAPVHFAPHPTQLSAMGTVVAEQQVALQPEVSGKVVALHPRLEPGGRVKKGEVLVTLDDTDYLLARESAASTVAQAEANLQLEQGNQLVAEKEYQLLGEPVSDEELALMLRRPQLASAEATVAAARAQLNRAALDVERTRVRAPFNAVVISRAVSLGSRVTTSTELTALVGSDRYRVEASVPSDQLQWLELSGPDTDGAQVRIFNRPVWGPEVSRAGTLISVGAQLESEGRMAEVLIRLDRPLDSGPDGDLPIPLLGSFVEVEINGRELPNAAEIPRSALHDGDQLWVMDAEQRLDIRSVEVAFRMRDSVLIRSGLQEGELLVTSQLAAPVAGMQLRLAENSTEQTREP